MRVLFRLLLNVVMKEEGMKLWGESAAVMKPSSNTTVGRLRKKAKMSPSQFFSFLVCLCRASGTTKKALRDCSQLQCSAKHVLFHGCVGGGSDRSSQAIC